MRRHAEDQRLAERMLAGDESAFTAFGERYFRACYRYTLSRLDGDRELARDLVQTAMTKALTHLDSYRGDASLFTWLCACCRNEILMHFRRRDAAPSWLELDDVANEEPLRPAAGYRASRPAGPEESLLRADRGQRVHLALDMLPEHHARALEWKYMGKASVREIAGRLEVSEKAAESVLSRARAAFRDAFRQVEHAAGGETFTPAKGRRP